MRWLPFLLIGALVLTMQSTLAASVSLGGARPDWLLIVVLFLACHVRPTTAAMGAWILGLGADLMTIERVGLFALSYTAAALLVSSVREYLFRAHALTQFVLTFVVSLILHLGWMVYRYVLYDPAQPWSAALIQDCVGGSLYTAVWAPLIHAMLWRMRYVLGVTAPRYRWTGLHRIGGGSV